MIKYLLFLLIVLCGVYTGNTYAGNYGVGSVWNLSNGYPNGLYGNKGYIVIEPYGLNQAGQGLIYHTHTDGSAYSPEVIIHYNVTNNHLGFKVYRWVPTGRTWIDVINNTTGTLTGFMPNTPLISNGDGTIDSNFSKYVTDVTIGTETKKAIYFDSTSVFQEQTGTTTGTWYTYVRIKNYGTGTNAGLMEMKWHYQWNGTKLENFNPNSNGHNQWAGTFEVFNGTGTPYNSTGTRSAGNYLMSYVAPNGLWTSYNTVANYMRTADDSFTTVYPPGELFGLTSGNSGFATYGAVSAGAWLAKVP